MLSSARRKNKDVSAFPQIAAKVCEVSNFSRLLPFPFPRQEKNVPFLNQHPPARARSQDGGGGGEGPLISVSKLFFFSFCHSLFLLSFSFSLSFVRLPRLCGGNGFTFSWGRVSWTGYWFFGKMFFFCFFWAKTHQSV